MSKKKNNGLKGLLLLSVVVLAILAIYLIEITQPNMRILVTTYSNNKPLINAKVSLDGKVKVSDDLGQIFFKIRASENDKLVVLSSAEGYKSVADTIKIDANRLKNKNISKYIVFEN